MSNQKSRKLKLYWVTDHSHLEADVKSKKGTEIIKALFDRNYDNWDPVRANGPRNAARGFAEQMGLGEESYERRAVYVREDGVEPWEITRYVVEMTVSIRYRTSKGSKVSPPREVR